jgi:hypothetical protein
MTRTVALLASVLLLLTACGSSDDGSSGKTPDALTGRVELADFSLDMPDGWAEADVQLDGPVVLAARGVDDENHQLIISSFAAPGDAEDAAIFAASGFVSTYGAHCRRLPKDTTFGTERLVFDCAFTDPGSFHKVLVIQKTRTRSALMMVQGDGSSLAGLAPLVSPLVAGWTWN